VKQRWDKFYKGKKFLKFFEIHIGLKQYFLDFFLNFSERQDTLLRGFLAIIAGILGPLVFLTTRDQRLDGDLDWTNDSSILFIFFSVSVLLIITQLVDLQVSYINNLRGMNIETSKIIYILEIWVLQVPQPAFHFKNQCHHFSWIFVCWEKKFWKICLFQCIFFIVQDLTVRSFNL